MVTNIADAVPRLKRLIPRLRGKRIGVLGDLMLDRYLWGTASRLSPEAPVPVVDFVEQSECLGGAGKLAANISTLGGEVEAFGVIGNDEAGRALQKCLSAVSIADKGIIADSKRVTTVKTRIIARHQQVVRVDHERREALRAETQEKLLGVLFSALKKLDALVLSDYDKGLITDDFADRVLSAAHHLNVPVFVGVKTRKLYAYRGSRLVTCNAKEASLLVGRVLGDERSFEEAGRSLLAHFGSGAVVITRGEKGMSIFEESSPRHRSEEHTSELQSRSDLVCRLLLEKKKKKSELQSRSDLVCRLLLEKKKKVSDVEDNKLETVIDKRIRDKENTTSIEVLTC